MSVIVFFKDTAPAEIYPLPKNAALPIYHHQLVESQSDAAGGRHAVLERPDEVLVQLLCLRVARGAQPRLLLEAAPLLLGIVQLAERVGELALLDEQLPPLHARRITALELGERRQRHRIVQHEGRLDQRGRSEEHTSELQSQSNIVCRLLLEKKK